ncbi:tRNA 2-thiouridine(34) synthase MnmA [Candidatus Spongiihabitans sp.]|uniref:tRNA 2-thiouridine(34) synthase MnmA n=1 Tax=Candidatus Spongiihabitans sp. TaxID=3101308 RepID=UPI003C6FFD0A
MCVVYNIIVGMSGGVDSSVAAARLIEQGHKVTGLFMKNWEEDDNQEYCSAAEDLADAEEVCKLLDIELKTINFSYEYWTRVFQLFLEEYRNGRTPNPDVVCNKEIKFKAFLDWAMHLGADFIATGHYARIEKQHYHYRHCNYLLRKGRDRRKDQSYFLHTLGQDALRYASFPIGEMRKQQVREQAKTLSLPTHDKKDSTGICFIGERRFSDFLGRFLPTQDGPIKTLEGETIGQHKGAYYYTIGQRQGLGIGGDGAAWYVAEKDVKRNIVYVVQGHDHPALMKKIVVAVQLHWITGLPPVLPANCKAKTRYRQDDQNCVISMIGINYTRIEFDHPQWAVTPGQSIVFYHDDVCLGGGIIKSALDA